MLQAEADTLAEVPHLGAEHRSSQVAVHHVAVHHAVVHHVMAARRSNPHVGDGREADSALAVGNRGERHEAAHALDMQPTLQRAESFCGNV